jgi:hypothetical protein
MSLILNQLKIANSLNLLGALTASYISSSGNITANTFNSLSSFTASYISASGNITANTFYGQSGYLVLSNSTSLYGSGGGLGIGTTSTTYTLNVAGRGYFFATNQDAGWGMLTLDYGNGTNSDIYAIQLKEGGATNAAIGFASYGSSDKADLKFYVNNGSSLSTAMTISGSGAVGIGTTSPTGTYGKLTVAGGIRTTDDTSSKLELGRYSAGAPNSYIKLGANSNALNITNAADSVDIFTILNGGNVGIGTTSPDQRLTIAGDANTRLRIDSSDTQGIYFTKSGANNGTFRVDGSGNYEWYTKNVSQAMVLTVGGNVGIGTTSPSYKLDVSLASTTSAVVQRWISPSYDEVHLYIGSSQAYFGTLSTTPLAFRTNNTERMRIALGGNVGIGTTSPLALLSVGDGSLTDANVPFQLSTAGSGTQTWIGINKNGSYGLLVGYQYGGGLGTGGMIRQVSSDPLYFIVNNVTEAMRINSSAQLMINTTAVSTFPRLNLGNTGIDLQVDATTTASTLMSANAVNNMLAIRAPFGYNPAGAANAGAKWGIWFSGGPSNDTVNYPYSSTQATSSLIAKSAAIYAISEDDSAGYNRKVGLSFYTSEFDATMTERLRISNTGNVGINVSSPSYKLEVSGDTGLRVVRTSNQDQHITITGGDGFGVSTVQAAYQLNLNSSQASYPMTFQIGGSEKMRISNGGDVGIGTSSPIAKLDSRGYISIGGGSDGIWLGNVGDNSAYDNVKLYYTGYNSGNPRIYLTPRTQPGSGTVNTYLHLQSITAGGPGVNNMGLLVDGNVGVGTSSPAYKLDVSGSANINNGGTGSLYLGYLPAGPTVAARITSTASPSYSTAGKLGFSVTTWGVGTDYGPTEMMAIDMRSADSKSPVIWMNPYGGNVGIGTTNPSTTLHVAGSARITGVLYDSSNSSGSNGQVLTSTGTGSLWSSAGAGVTGTGTTNYVPKFTAATTLGNSVIQDDGTNIGIGITPTSQSNYRFLQVSGTTSAIIETMVGSTRIGGFDSDVNALYVGTITNLPISFRIAVNEKMRLNTNGNLGIGTTSPAQKLDVDGGSSPVQIQLKETSTAYHRVGLRKSGSLFQIGEPSNDGTSTYTPILTVDMNGDNVGIGTASPSYKLDVNVAGTGVGVRAYNGGNYLQMGGIGGGTAYFKGYESIVAYGNIYGGYVTFLVGDAEKVRIDNSGNVGIGTTSPNYKLDVQGGSARLLQSGGVSLNFSNNATRNWDIGLAASTDAFYIKDVVANLTRVTVDTSGNVGIGTASPSQKLEVNDGNLLVGNSINNNSINATRTGPNYASLALQAYTDSPAIAWSGAGGYMRFVTGSIEQMRLTSTGNLGIGTNTPLSRLHISGSSSTAITITDDVLYTNTITNDNAVMTYTVDTGNAAAGSAAHIFKRYNTELARIDYNGNVGIGTASPSSKLNVQEVGTDGTPAIRITTTSAPSTFSWATSFMNSSLTAGKNYILLFGQAESSNNSGYIGFNYQGAGSTSNFVTIGHYGNNNLLNITGGGNVGIGTTSPSYKLDVNGTANVTGDGNSGTPDLYINGAGGFGYASGQVRAYAPNNTTLAYYWDTSYVTYYNAIRIVDGSSNVKIYLDNGNSPSYFVGGNVGVGTTTPNAKLDVNGNTIITGSLTVTDTITAPNIYGTSYTSLVDSGSGVAYKDTITTSGPALYELSIVANPNGAGSGQYRDFLYGKIIIGTGWNGSAVTDYISYVQENPDPRSLYTSGGGTLSVDIRMLSGSVEYNSLPVGATYTLRVKISGYNTTSSGQNTTIRLRRMM